MRKWFGTLESGSSGSPPARWKERRVAAALTMVAALMMACTGSPTSVNPGNVGGTPGYGFACGTSDHPSACEAQVAWAPAAAASFQGLAADITLAPLTCHATCTSTYGGGGTATTGYLMNAVQLLDQGSQRWIRLGYETVPTDTQDVNALDPVVYFWDTGVADQQVAVHYLGPVPSDANQQWGHYDIHQTAPDAYAISLNQIRQGGGSLAFTDAAHLTTFPLGSSKRPTPTALTPTAIVVGEELAGNGEAGASLAWYADLQWYDSAGAVHDQNSVGIVRQDKPPYGGWIAPPSATFSGWFQTYCCIQRPS